MLNEIYCADMTKKILVSGSLAYDRIMTFPGLFSDHLLPDKLHALSVSFTVDTLEQSFGGTAGNIAYGLSMLGETSALLAVAGKDFGVYDEWLKNCKIDTSSIQRETDVNTASAHIITDKADNQITAFYPGALAVAYAKPLDFTDAVVAIVAPSSTADMESLPQKYRDQGLPFFFDPGQQTIALSKEQMQNGIAGSAGVFANKYEMEIISQKTGWDIPELLQHAAMVVVTLGAEGSIIHTREKEYQVRAVQLKSIVDPTGAGDAYRAGFIKGTLLGLSADSCARIASVVASYAVETRGTQGYQFVTEHLKARYEETYAEQLTAF